MLVVTGLNALVVVILAAWLRARRRRLAGEVPCLATPTPRRATVLGAAGWFGYMIPALAVTVALAPRGGGHVDAFVFVAWLLSTSIASILVLVCLSTRAIDRDALVWVRTIEPDVIVLREPGAETKIKLTPSSVRAAVVVNGVGAPSLVQYFVRHGERTANLVVPYTIRGTSHLNAPWMSSYTGAVLQGGGVRFHQFMAPFCQKPPVAPV